MIKNYLKIAFRNIVNQKLYSSINVFGLAIGMTCSILILLWVMDEFSYDTFHENSNDIYRVVENQYYAGGEIFPVAVTPGPLAKALREEYPEIINSCRVTMGQRSLKYKDNNFNEVLTLVDSSFLEMFTFPLIEGDINTVLSNPFSILLSEKAAEKYFGSESPIGKSIIVGGQLGLEVTGVFKNIPKNSHLSFEILVPFKILNALGRDTEIWSNNSYFTYIQLIKGADHKLVESKIKDIIQRNNEDSKTEIYLQQLLDIHLYSGSKYTADLGGHGSIEYVNIFLAIAGFVLLIACINFMNLSTARASKRAKEVGLRKVVGAERFQIIKQFFVESILLALIALVFSHILVKIILPLFNDISGKEIDFWKFDINVILGLIILAILTGIISGSYPALHLSSFLPAKILKENNSIDNSGSMFRKVLVVFQFSLSIILIIGTVVVFSQLNFIQERNLGFEKDNILFFQTSEEVKNKLAETKNELLNNPNILAVCSSNNVPTYYGNSSTNFEWEGKNPDEVVLFHHVDVDKDYLKTFQMKIKEGRFFSKEFISDSSAIVINETAAKIMNMQNPVGKRINRGDAVLNIVGVIEDFHFKKMDTKIEPLIIFNAPNENNLLFARINPTDIPTTIKFIETTMNHMDPSQPFEYYFLDERFDRLYRSEQRMGNIFSAFSILAIIISCMGLFGLASFMAERRKKEIGVRKVLGASTSSITILLSSEFTKLIIISNLLAWPIGWWIMNSWLKDFVYRIDMGLWMFLVSGLIAFVVAILTVSYQAIRASFANPVKSLKYE